MTAAQEEAEAAQEAAESSHEEAAIAQEAAAKAQEEASEEEKKWGARGGSHLYYHMKEKREQWTAAGGSWQNRAALEKEKPEKDKELASLRDGDDSVTTEGATGAAVETDERESLRTELAAKDEELARVKEELASLRALLPPPAPSEEGLPPSS